MNIGEAGDSPNKLKFFDGTINPSFHLIFEISHATRLFELGHAGS